MNITVQMRLFLTVSIIIAFVHSILFSISLVNTDTTPLKKQYEEMHKIGVNINQITKKVNSTGDLYSEEAVKDGEGWLNLDELKALVGE